MQKTIRYTPWDALLRGSSLFDHFPNHSWSTRGRYPKVNAWRNDNDLTVTAELPGVAADAVNVNVHDDILTIAGESRPSAREGEATYHRNERTYGRFNRQLRLPFRADADKTSAILKDGILSITIYPSADDQPKKIAVVAG